jgi:hypothetical protein
MLESENAPAAVGAAVAVAVGPAVGDAECCGVGAFVALPPGVAVPPGALEDPGAGIPPTSGVWVVVPPPHPDTIAPAQTQASIK